MGNSTRSRRLLGRILLDGNLISPSELELALAQQQHSGEMLGQVLVRLNILDETRVRAALVLQEHLDSVESAVKIAAGSRDKLGLLLCKSGYLSEETLDNALTLQKATGEKLGEILVRIGVISDEQLAALLQFQQNQENGPTQGSPLQLGELLITIGVLTREQLKVALEKRRQSSCKLGEILVENGFLTADQITHSLNLQQKLVAASLAAVLAMSLSACGNGSDRETESAAHQAEFADPANPGKHYRWANYLTLPVDEYGLVAHNFYSSTNNAQFWSVQADIADDIYDSNALTVLRIDIRKNGDMPTLNKKFAIEENPFHPKFPGDILIFNGQKSTYKKVESGTITFTPNSDAAIHVQGTFDVIMTDYDASQSNPPHYRIKGDFSFRIGTYGPVKPNASKS